MSNSISNIYTKFDYFPSGVWPYIAIHLSIGIYIDKLINRSLLRCYQVHSSVQSSNDW